MEDVVGVVFDARRAGTAVLACTLLAWLAAATPAYAQVTPEPPPVGLVVSDLPAVSPPEPDLGPAELVAPQLEVLHELREGPPDATKPPFVTDVPEDDDSVGSAPSAPESGRSSAALLEPAPRDLHGGDPRSLAASIPAARTVAAVVTRLESPTASPAPRGRRTATRSVPSLEARPVAATSAAPAEDGGLLGAAGALVDYLPEWVKALLALMSIVLAGLLAAVLISRRQLARALRRAHFDVVTGLPNRAAIDEELDRRVGQASRNESPLAVAMVDIDNFKAINDDYGHAKGDEVLAAVGAVARRTLRSGDLVGRFGGEELVLILPDTDEAGARTAAEKLRLALGEITVPGLERGITASVGVAATRGDRTALEGLVYAADAAMYRAKALGRDRSELASDLDATLART